MAKYHIDKNGQAVVCPAEIRCTKIDSKGQPAPHFEGSQEGASKWAEKVVSHTLGGNIGAVTKKNNVSSKDELMRKQQQEKHQQERAYLQERELLEHGMLERNTNGSSQQYSLKETRDIVNSQREIERANQSLHDLKQYKTASEDPNNVVMTKQEQYEDAVFSRRLNEENDEIQRIKRYHENKLNEMGISQEQAQVLAAQETSHDIKPLSDKEKLDNKYAALADKGMFSKDYKGSEYDNPKVKQTLNNAVIDSHVNTGFMLTKIDGKIPYENSYKGLLEKTGDEKTAFTQAVKNKIDDVYERASKSKRKPSLHKGTYDAGELNNSGAYISKIAPGDYVVSTYHDGSKSLSVYSNDLSPDNELEFAQKNKVSPHGRYLKEVSVYSNADNETRKQLVNNHYEIYTNRKELQTLQKDRTDLANSGFSFGKRRKLKEFDKREEELVKRNRELESNQ